MGIILRFPDASLWTAKQTSALAQIVGCVRHYPVSFKHVKSVYDSLNAGSLSQPARLSCSPQSGPRVTLLLTIVTNEELFSKTL